MTDTTFVDYSTTISAEWLNEVNDHVHSSTPVSPATTVHPASVIANTPAGSLAATTVQTALNELDTEKEATANKSTTLIADQASDTKFPSVKSVYDWVVTTLLGYVGRTSATGSAQIPSGTTAQRGTPPAYSLRGNSDSTKLEFTPDGTNWSGLGGASGSGGDAIFWINGKTITTSHTILSTENAGTFGPVTIDTGATVTIETGGVWTVV